MRKRWTVSKVLACGILLVDGIATLAVLYFCSMAIRRDFNGALPYLTALIGALQAATAVVLSAYFCKSRAENTRGGIIYDTAVNPDRDC